MRLRDIVIMALVPVLTAGCGNAVSPNSDNAGQIEQAAVTSGAAFVTTLGLDTQTASTSFSWSSSGQPIQITHVQTGIYDVDFPGLATDLGGNVQVSALSFSPG